MDCVGALFAVSSDHKHLAPHWYWMEQEVLDRLAEELRRSIQSAALSTSPDAPQGLIRN